MKTEAVIIGASAGGIPALCKILAGNLHETSPPVILVLHRGAFDKSDYASVFTSSFKGIAKEAEDKEAIAPFHIYVAPAGYHLLIERDRTFSLSVDDKVNWARPSIDVLFESAADAYTSTLVAIILTGANRDGADGLKKVAAEGGLAIVQDPVTAAYPAMPMAAIEATSSAKIYTLENIGALIKSFTMKVNEKVG